MNRLILGWILSAVWVAVVFAFFLIKETSPLHLQPYEFGDFLAGTTAPLAFLWLIIGYFQQTEQRAFEQAANRSKNTSYTRKVVKK